MALQNLGSDNPTEDATTAYPTAAHAALTVLSNPNPAVDLSLVSASQNAARVYIASLESETSRSTMVRALNVVAGILVPDADLDSIPWGMLRFQHTNAVRAQLGERYDYQAANKTLSALRQTLKRAWRLGQMTADEYMAACDVQNIKGDRPPQAAGRALSMGEVLALVVAANDGTPSGVRDTAILAVAYAGGLRRAEIAGMALADFSSTNGQLVVHGKRNKVRNVPVQDGALAAVTDWVAIRGDWSGSLFGSTAATFSL